MIHGFIRRTNLLTRPDLGPIRTGLKSRPTLTLTVKEEFSMPHIQRIGESSRWSDIVIYRGEARWVEVAEDATQDVHGQIEQVLNQIDATLHLIGSNRACLLQVMIYLSDLETATVLNEQWDRWVPSGNPPIRACVETKLAPGYLVEMVISAAVEPAVN